MNVIILTGRFGMGHVKAAEAIKEEILRQNGDNNAEIIDFMDFLFPNTSEYIYKAFGFLVSRCSGVYNSLNKAAGKNAVVPLKATVVRKIDSLLEKHNADAVVVAFPVCGQYISAYKRMRRCHIPLYTYITDITAHEEWISPGTDKYMVGDIRTKNTLLSRGVSEDKVIISGIPVRESFYKKPAKARSSPKEILIMGGGLGLIPSSGDLLKTLNDSENIKVTLIAGKNKKLLADIKARYRNIEAIGYTENVDFYMKRADLIVTKAGGITTFEAMAAKTPLYIIKPFLEQEFGNAKYIEEHNIGRVLWNKDSDEIEDIMNLIKDDELLNTMKMNMEKLITTFEKANLYEGTREEIRKCN